MSILDYKAPISELTMADAAYGRADLLIGGMPIVRQFSGIE